jgi:F0F1-type ATP synthase delta subunit
VLLELAAYLVTYKQIAQLELFVSDIERNLAEMGAVNAQVTVAHPLTAELTKAVEAYVMRIEDAKSVSLEEKLDPTILGGIVIETPHKRFDSSVSTQLKRLRNV